MQVFDQSSAECAASAVHALAEHGFGLDCRGQHLRIGFGFNHSKEEVQKLCGGIAKLNCS